jgi:hypothetical protein
MRTVHVTSSLACADRLEYKWKMKLQFKWFRQHTQIFQLGAMCIKTPPSRLTSNFKRLITSIGGDTPSVAHAYSPVSILAHIIHTSNK